MPWKWRSRGLQTLRPVFFPFHLFSRILPDDCDAVISWDWSVPGIFELIASAGEVSSSEMRKVFNMGAGMLVVVRDGDFDMANAILRDSGETPFEAGEIVPGSGGVANE